MSRVYGVLAGCAALALAACGGVPAGDAGTPSQLNQAALLAASCSGCHAQGGSAGGITSLEGQRASALRKKLLAYRNDADGGTAMHRMARGYTDAQIALIANYLGD